MKRLLFFIITFIYFKISKTVNMCLFTNHRMFVSYCVRLALCPFPIVRNWHYVRLQPLCVRFLLCPIGIVSDRQCPFSIVCNWHCVRLLMCPIVTVSDLNRSVSVSYCVQLGLCPFAITVCSFPLILCPIDNVSICYCVRLALCPIVTVFNFNRNMFVSYCVATEPYSVEREGVLTKWQIYNVFHEET